MRIISDDFVLEIETNLPFKKTKPGYSLYLITLICKPDGNWFLLIEQFELDWKKKLQRLLCDAGKCSEKLQI
jgi:hypothetical protein